MTTDRNGNALSGASAQAVAAYDNAVATFNIYSGDPVGLLDAAIAAAPRFTMAHILKAWLFALATEPDATTQARAIAAHAPTLEANAREASHLGALALLLDGEWTQSAIALDRHNLDWPHDLVAIQAGHLMDFYRANARNLRDRIARVLPQWSPSMPGHSALLGMLSFGLEEAGDYARAEDAGREALDRQPLDSWAHHAVAHVMEMQGRAEDGIGWMAAREASWTGEANFFQVHNWWHKALFHLDLDQKQEALALYDRAIRGQPSMIALDMVDASALLWRLALCGVDVGNRWDELATAWQAHADGRLYPFNDWHAAMAWLGAGREGEVERLLAAWRAAGDAGETGRWGAMIAVPLIEGFAAFWRGDHEAAVSSLHGVRYLANSFGGSHAQRDVIDWTLSEAAIRGGMAGVARSLANERLALKPHSPVNRRFLSRAQAIAA